MVGKWSCHPLRVVCVSQRSYRLLPLSPLTAVRQSDTNRTNREACSVKWLSCKYRLTWSETPVICKLIQHPASSPLTSESWDGITEHGLEGGREERGPHTAQIVLCVCMCVCWSFKWQPWDDHYINSTESRVCPRPKFIEMVIKCEDFSKWETPIKPRAAQSTALYWRDEWPGC